LLALSFIGQAYADPEISRVEYFFDSAPTFGDEDPGYGLATGVTITPSADISDLEFMADISPLSAGLHILHVRVMDSDNKWSHDYVSSFLKIAVSDASQITEVEYFFDTDPGYGNGTDVPVTPARNLDDVTFTADISGLSEGVHMLHVRSKDDKGKWSLDQTGLLAILGSVGTAKITRIEYFIDTDPGFDNGTNVPIAAAEDVTVNFLADTTGLSEGTHHLLVRSKDEQGRYSPVYMAEFTVSADTDNDGIPDDWEIGKYSDIDAYDDSGDPDNDDLGMLDEFINQTEIFDPDTDGDGLLDGAEIQKGLDPLESDYPPSVVTGSITELSASKATISSNAVSYGGTSPVTVRGVCYSEYSTPTVADSKTVNGTGTGSFTSSLSGLLPETTYYVRAYATNTYGTVYGDEVYFKTDVAAETKVNPGIFLLLLSDDEG
jgi:hypothetical protein